MHRHVAKIRLDSESWQKYTFAHSKCVIYEYSQICLECILPVSCCQQTFFVRIFPMGLCKRKANTAKTSLFLYDQIFREILCHVNENLFILFWEDFLDPQVLFLPRHVVLTSNEAVWKKQKSFFICTCSVTQPGLQGKDHSSTEQLCTNNKCLQWQIVMDFTCILINY